MHRSADPSVFPRAPSTPRVLNSSQSSLTVAWDPPSGTSTLIGYTLEYFSPDLQTGWVVAAHRVISHTYTVRLILLQLLRPVRKSFSLIILFYLLNSS